MASRRTQIYLTEDQRRRLDQRSRHAGRSLAEVVREAVDAYLVEKAPDADRVLEETFGSLPDLKVPGRGEWDRG